MNAVQSIRRHGFRKWYERQLLQGHACLVMLLLAALALMGSFEVFGMHLPLPSRLAIVACAVASAGIGLWALRRYLYLLQHAEFVADQAVCPQCDTYARWSLEEGELPPDGPLPVVCRCCGNRWRIEL